MLWNGPGERRRKWGKIKSYMGKKTEVFEFGVRTTWTDEKQNTTVYRAGVIPTDTIPVDRHLFVPFLFFCENVSSLYILSIPLKSTHMCAPIFLPDRAQVFEWIRTTTTERARAQVRFCQLSSVCSTVNNLSPTHGSRERARFTGKKGARFEYLTLRDADSGSRSSADDAQLITEGCGSQVSSPPPLPRPPS